MTQLIGEMKLLLIFAISSNDTMAIYILPQSSGNLDPEVHPELKTPPDPFEILIRRNL